MVTFSQMELWSTRKCFRKSLWWTTKRWRSITSFRPLTSTAWAAQGNEFAWLLSSSRIQLRQQFAASSRTKSSLPIGLKCSTNGLTSLIQEPLATPRRWHADLEFILKSRIRSSKKSAHALSPWGREVDEAFSHSKKEWWSQSELFKDSTKTWTRTFKFLSFWHQGSTKIQLKTHFPRFGASAHPILVQWTARIASGWFCSGKMALPLLNNRVLQLNQPTLKRCSTHPLSSWPRSFQMFIQNQSRKNLQTLIHLKKTAPKQLNQCHQILPSQALTVVNKVSGMLQATSHTSFVPSTQIWDAKHVTKDFLFKICHPGLLSFQEAAWSIRLKIFWPPSRSSKSISTPSTKKNLIPRRA